MSTQYKVPDTQLPTSPEHSITSEDIARIDHTEQKHANRIHALEVRVSDQEKLILRLKRDIGRLKNQIDHLSSKVRG